MNTLVRIICYGIICWSFFLSGYLLCNYKWKGRITKIDAKVSEELAESTVNACKSCFDPISPNPAKDYISGKGMDKTIIKY